MAIYHLTIKIGSKGKGQSAVAAAAYRAGDKLKDNATGQISDYTSKKGVVFSEIALCENAPAEYADRATLWNAVQKAERNMNAQLWREFEAALPKEMSRKEQIETCRAFAKMLTALGMCVDWSLHDKGDGNVHMHAMVTMRSITPDGKWAPKSRKVYDLDENGERIFQKVDKTGRKQYKSHKEDYNNWNAKERVVEWRKAWADCCNERLLEKDHIDHRSYAERGINQLPTIHEGYVARKRVAAGLPSERVQYNEAVRQLNVLRQLRQQLEAIVEKLKLWFKEKMESSKSVAYNQENVTTDRDPLRYDTIEHEVAGKEYPSASHVQKAPEQKKPARPKKEAWEKPPIKEDRLQSILRQHQLWLYSGRLYGCKANFAGQNLYLVDLSHQDLRYADFTGAYLDHVNLTGTRLSGAVFSAADLTDANLTDAVIDNIDWSDVDTSKAIMPDWFRREASIIEDVLGSIGPQELFGLDIGEMTEEREEDEEY